MIRADINWDENPSLLDKGCRWQLSLHFFGRFNNDGCFIIHRAFFDRRLKAELGPAFDEVSPCVRVFFFVLWAVYGSEDISSLRISIKFSKNNKFVPLQRAYAARVCARSFCLNVRFFRRERAIAITSNGRVCLSPQ